MSWVIEEIPTLKSKLWGLTTVYNSAHLGAPDRGHTHWKAASRLHCKKRSCKGSHDRVRLREGVTHVLVGEGETLTVRGLQKDLQRKEVYNYITVCLT